MGLWQRPRTQEHASRGAKSVLRLALDGGSLDEICEAAHNQLARELLHRAERFGILIFRLQEDPVEGSDRVGGAYLRLWTEGRAEESLEWNASEVQRVIPSLLWHSGASIEVKPETPFGGVGAGPDAGMRKWLWTPVRSAPSGLAGVLFAGSRTASARLPKEALEAAAEELAAALALRKRTTGSQDQAHDQEFAVRVLAASADSGPLDGLLETIVEDAQRLVKSASHRPHFVILGLVESGGPAVGSSLDLRMKFHWSAGDQFLARAAMGEGESPFWRRALELRKTQGQETNAALNAGQSSRIVAVPILAGSEPLGVLMAGLDQGTSLGLLKRLEFRAALAATAILNERRAQQSGDSFLAAKFFMRNVGEPVFLLGRTQEVIAANVAAVSLISAGPGNDAGAPAVSLQPEKLRNISSAQLFRFSESPRVREWLQRIASPTEQSKPADLSSELLTGRRVRLQAAPLSGQNIALIIQDAMAREKPESQRADSEIQNLMESVDQGLLVLDESDSLRWYNQRFAKLFGLPPEELRKVSSLGELLSLASANVADPARFAERWWSASTAAGSLQREEIRILRPSPRTLERRIRQIVGNDGAHLGRVETYTDLTVNTQLQAKLQKSERLVAIGQKVSGIAHELSNPLTTILGYAQRLLRAAPGVRGAPEIRLICSEAERAAGILRQLLGSARETESVRGAVDLNHLLMKIADLQAPQLELEKIRFEFDLAPGIPPVHADPGELQQIVMNLVSNSRHALLHQNGGAIILRTQLAESGRVLLEIADTGPGIPDALRDRIFDPFFTTKPPGIGTGLGLPIVKALVQQNEGNIVLASLPGPGASFSIDLPAAAALSEKTIHVPASPSLTSPVSQFEGKVLIVEDEPTVAQLIADMLADLGYRADLMHNARRALIAALNYDYALVICDMKMPGLDGQHFYRALVEAGSPLAPRFLFVTGDVLGLTTQEFLRANSLAHIAKPFRVEEFSDKVSRMLQAVPDAGAFAPPVLEKPRNAIGRG
jgi:signal transduction histidine kinase